MTQPQKKLSFRNRWIDNVVQSTPNGTVHLPLDEQFLFPDKTTTQTLIWRVNQNEFIQVFSGLMYAIDSAYPDAAIDTMEIFLRMVSDTMEFCDEVTNCIENNTATQDAISDILNSNGTVNPDMINPDATVMNDRFPPSERDEDTHAPPAGCNLDALWAGIFEMVERLDEYGRDFLETVVANSDKAERAASIVALVPLIGDVIGETILELAEIAPDLLNAYNAYSSQVELENISCALFEMVCAECRYPTYQEVYDYFATFGITGIQDIATIAYQAMVDYVIGTNGLANKVIYFTMIVFVLFTLYLGGSWLNLRGKKWLSIWNDIGEDNPDNGWELLCDGCSQDFCDDYLSSQGGITVVGGNGSYTAAGWTSVDVGATVRLTLQRDYGSSQNIDSVSVKFNSNTFSYTDIFTQLRLYDPDTTTVIATWDISQLIGTQTDVVFTHNSQFTASRFWIQFDVTNGADGTVSLVEMCVTPQGA